jgi:hypothetical protein
MLDFVVQRRSFQLQKLRRPPLVAAGSDERGFDHLDFDFARFFAQIGRPLFV